MTKVQQLQELVSDISEQSDEDALVQLRWLEANIRKAILKIVSNNYDNNSKPVSYFESSTIDRRVKKEQVIDGDDLDKELESRGICVTCG